MTSPCPILAGYRLVRSESCACLSSMYVQNLPAAHASAMIGLHSMLSIFDYFLVSLSFMVCPIRAGPCLTVGFAFLQPTLFPATILSYHFINPAAKLFCLNLVGPLWACRLFFSQWPSTTIGSFIISLAGSCVSFVFPWVSRARLLPLGFLGPFLNFAFP